MIRFRFSLNVIFLYGLVACTTACKDEPVLTVAAMDAEQLFAFQVFPLLESKCFGCHGEEPEEIEGEFDMRSLQGMLAGGESGKPALLGGHPEQSPLYLAAARVDEDFAMPPKENDRLDADQLSFLKQWIEAGAPWPNESRRATIIASGDWDFKGKIAVPTSGGQNDSWTHRKYNTEDIWSFYPVKEVDIPTAGKHPIDAFIDEQLDRYHLQPAPKTDKQALIRRATFDLTGLPPTRQEIEQFMQDNSEKAFERLVDRLLASPHYGEQWGRHWLDVVRYADSDGFANDYARPNAWRYRDYVIRSFNADKPYNRFVMEQIAGDEINPRNPELLVATGFLRMGPWEHTSMSVEAETRQFYLDDISNSVGEVFMAQPLRCARCHDHKFDPIPTRDVYRIQAVFATTQFAERPAPFMSAENISLLNKEKQRVQSALDLAKAESEKISQKEEEAIREWFKEKGRKYVARKLRRKLPENRRPPRYLGLSFAELGYRKLLSKRLQRLRKEMDAFEPLAYGVYTGPKRKVHSQHRLNVPENLEGEAEKTYILKGGSIYSKTDEVQPGILSVLASFQPWDDEQKPNKSLDVHLPADLGARRLAFAKWLTHPDHPLSSRVMVNRIWQYHFGQGIAGNPNNFGATGKKPTHPKLLDWLARYFVEKGWSVKALHRLIMLSDTYQRSSEHPDLEVVKQIDPDNHYLAMFSPRRLAAEEIRDAILLSSGELNPEMGGLPVRPEIHPEVALQPRHVMGSIAPAYQPSPTRAQRHRRSIYALRLRGLRDPLLEVFNQPGSELSCELRLHSTVTPQAFLLFNDENIRDRGVALADRVAKAATTTGGHIQELFLAVLKRDPGRKEIQLAEDYLDKMSDYHRQQPYPAKAYPKFVQREMFEEMTGETFSFTEPLEVYDQDFEADLKMWEVPPETRALADLAVVLFNTNEFMYIY